MVKVLYCSSVVQYLRSVRCTETNTCAIEQTIKAVTLLELMLCA